MSDAEDRCGTLAPRESVDEMAIGEVMIMSDIADFFEPFVFGILHCKHPEFSEDELRKVTSCETVFLVSLWLSKLEPYRCASGGFILPELNENLLPPNAEIDYSELTSFEYLNLANILDVLGVVGTSDDRESVVTKAFAYLTV